MMTQFRSCHDPCMLEAGLKYTWWSLMTSINESPILVENKCANPKIVLLQYAMLLHRYIAPVHSKKILYGQLLATSLSHAPHKGSVPHPYSPCMPQSLQNNALKTAQFSPSTYTVRTDGNEASSQKSPMIKGLAICKISSALRRNENSMIRRDNLMKDSPLDKEEYAWSLAESSR